MPHPPVPHATTRLPPHKLLVLTAAVALAHLVLLGEMPASFGWMSGSAGAQKAGAVTASFVTRTVAPEPAAVTTPAAPKRKPRSEMAVARLAAQSAPAAESIGVSSPAIEVSAIPSNAISAMEPPAAPPEKTPDPAPTPSSLAASTAAAAAAEVQHAQKVKYAGPVLMQFDGRGEEGGYKKYAASGELLWQPDSLQYNAYNARLEITALFFRVRTWTSKGELTDGGLQPLRFGDKPRGAEQATHFQRDKGIISFSANNPDVPLQAGAQDKLSALLQLSAMVAGEPERYPAGSSIRFQAADAHRAELWNFKASAAETLELPGGTLRTVKFTKDPTVEFDQRVEVWLASTLQYLPVRIRVTESNGNFVDLLWRKSQNPD